MPPSPPSASLAVASPLCRQDTEKVAHNIDDNIVNVLKNPIKNDIVSDMVRVYSRLNTLLSSVRLSP
jgi:hypothetical protein